MGDLLSLAEEASGPPSPSPAGASGELLTALPPLPTPAAVRERAVELLRRIDPSLADLLPDDLPFPPEDDPFTKTYEDWESAWYGIRESAYRVYLNQRMEFRRHLQRALEGTPNDLKPWTYWVFNGARPADGEPVYGLTEERRTELGWAYPGPATDFRIYGEVSPDAASAGG